MWPTPVVSMDRWQDVQADTPDGVKWWKWENVIRYDIARFDILFPCLTRFLLVGVDGARHAVIRRRIDIVASLGGKRKFL